MSRPCVVLCGGGNGTHVLAALLGARGDLDVRVVTREPARWARRVTCTETRIAWGRLPHFGPTASAVTHGDVQVHGWDDLEAALRGATQVVLGCPVHQHEALLRPLLPHLAGRRVALGTLYAQGGFDWTARRLLAELGLPAGDLLLFGLKRFPFLCKVERYGEAVRLHGRFSRLLLATWGGAAGDDARLAAALGDWLARPVTTLPHFLVCALTLSNQLLHPAIAWGLLQDTGPDQRFDRPVPFYGSTTAAAAGMLNDLCMELRSLARQLEPVAGRPLRRFIGGEPSIATLLAIREVLHPLEAIGPLVSLRDHLMAAGFRSNKRLAPALLPTVPAPDGRGRVVDFTSRFWRDDLPHGLCVVAGLGEIVGADLPQVHRMIRVHQGWMGRRYLGDDGRLDGADLAETNAPQTWGVHDLRGLAALVGAR